MNWYTNGDDVAQTRMIPLAVLVSFDNLPFSKIHVCAISSKSFGIWPRTVIDGFLK